MSKAREIEKHLLAGNSITGLQALNEFGVYRLSSVINRLRKKGHKIVTDMIFYGDSEYADYFIPKESR